MTPHRRFNPLLGEWVLVSPHRALRPWQGQTEPAAIVHRPAYDADCYLCPGNVRASGERNPIYSSSYTFPNDFPALLTQSDAPPSGTVLRAEAARGEARVICYSPDHSLTLADMSEVQIEGVVGEWVRQSVELGAWYPWVQIFENKGEMMGCSNPHPHGQVWACDFLPSLADKEDRNQRAYLNRSGRILLLDALEEELKDGSRVVAETDAWALVVPFWAAWPFEYLLTPKRHVSWLSDLTGYERADLAKILKIGLGHYDRLFGTSFPYSMGWHQASFGAGAAAAWQLHAHFYPPLLRSATVRKFMVGFEMLGEPQRDITPEQAAERLRNA